jgi:hypothetical protein
VVTVGYFELALSAKGPRWGVKATVGIVDGTDSPVKDVAVTGDWYYNGSLIAAGVIDVTHGHGEARFDAGPLEASSGDMVTFVVTDVSKAGCVWDGSTEFRTVLVP